MYLLEIFLQGPMQDLKLCFVCCLGKGDSLFSSLCFSVKVTAFCLTVNPFGDLRI